MSRLICLSAIMMMSVSVSAKPESIGTNLKTEFHNRFENPGAIWPSCFNLSDTDDLVERKSARFRLDNGNMSHELGPVKNKPFTSYTIFQGLGTPSFPSANDGSGIEVGVKFRSSQAGSIIGLRYYKGSGSTGTRKGHLWTSAGQLLVEATFTSETSSGWQEVLFTTPVSITPNVTYVASCFSPSGDYALSNPYFTAAVVNGPIKALADDEDGPNGMYSYTSSPTFPTTNVGSSNYWVDVVFSPADTSGNTGGSMSGTANYIAKFTATDTIANSILYENGTSVGIGTTNIGDANYKLFVEAGIRTRKIKVDQATWSDYVFDSTYRLPSLLEVEKFIQLNKHLPDVPSAKEVAEKGLDLGNNQAVLLKKIEELTLYIIELKKENENLNRRLIKMEGKKK